LNRPVFELTPRSWTNFKGFHEEVSNRVQAGSRQELSGWRRWSKALGASAERQSDIFWRAIEVYSPQLARGVADHLTQHREEDVEGLDVVEK